MGGGEIKGVRQLGILQLPLSRMGLDYNAGVQGLELGHNHHLRSVGVGLNDGVSALDLDHHHDLYALDVYSYSDLPALGRGNRPGLHHQMLAFEASRTARVL